MNEIILFLLLLGIILIISGYLEMYFDNKKITNKTEYRFLPRNVFDSTESKNLKDQFEFMFNATDVRNQSNLV